jgi:hypothetical protein
MSVDRWGAWALSGGGPDLVRAVSEVRQILDRTGFARGLIPFVVIGASGDVFPAALLVVEARRRRIRTLLLHLNPGKNAQSFDEAVCGEGDVILPEWVDSPLS